MLIVPIRRTLLSFFQIVGTASTDSPNLVSQVFECVRQRKSIIRLGLEDHAFLLTVAPDFQKKIFGLVNEFFQNMKFLEYTPLDSINDFLSHVDLGECTIKGNLEAYSCKHTGTDRKLSRSLELEILDCLGQSLDSDSPSPAEFLSSRSSRKTLIYLVLTLSHMYPDYDFSVVQAHLFFREEEWDCLKQIFDTFMSEAAKKWSEVNGSPLMESLYKALDEVVKLAECEIYSYNPDSDGDPFLERGAIWSFNFFFYNRKLKRVVSFRCCCLSNLVEEGFLTNDHHNEEEEEGDIFEDMDM